MDALREAAADLPLACGWCDDSDEEFCVIHDPAADTAPCRCDLANGAVCEACDAVLTDGGTYPCPGPAQCTDFDCPCG